MCFAAHSIFRTSYQDGRFAQNSSNSCRRYCENGKAFRKKLFMHLFFRSLPKRVRRCREHGIIYKPIDTRTMRSALLYTIVHMRKERTFRFGTALKLRYPLLLNSVVRISMSQAAPVKHGNGDHQTKTAEPIIFMIDRAMRMQRKQKSLVKTLIQETALSLGCAVCFSARRRFGSRTCPEGSQRQPLHSCTHFHRRDGELSHSTEPSLSIIRFRLIRQNSVVAVASSFSRVFRKRSLNACASSVADLPVAKIMYINPKRLR